MPVRAYPSVGERDGHDGGGLHDPGERVPHEAQELEDLALLLLLQLVGAEDLEALLRLLRGEAGAAASQVVEHLLQGYVLLQHEAARTSGSQQQALKKDQTHC